MDEEKNSELFLRPRFQLDLDQSSDVLLDRFKSNLMEGDCKYCSRIVDNHIVIDVPENESHFWSPQLQVEIEEIDPKKAKIKGLFGPKPQVWTLFMFIHFAVGTAFLVFTVIVYSRWSLKESLIFPVAMLVGLVIIWILLYLLGRLGKSTGEKQMTELKSFMNATLQKVKA